MNNSGHQRRRGCSMDGAWASAPDRVFWSLDFRFEEDLTAPEPLFFCAAFCVDLDAFLTCLVDGFGFAFVLLAGFAADFFRPAFFFATLSAELLAAAFEVDGFRRVLACADFLSGVFLLLLTIQIPFWQGGTATN